MFGAADDYLKSSRNKEKKPGSSVTAVRRLVLDVLKPHEPNILIFAQKLSALPGVDGVDITVYEIDSKVENVKITMMGNRLEFGPILSGIEELGGSVHSIDKVATGRILVEEVPTPQD